MIRRSLIQPDLQKLAQTQRVRHPPGGYIEMMFTLAKDTKLDITIKINGTVLALGMVVTCDPNVGNGIKFTKMLPEDQEELRRYLEAAQEASESST